MPSRLLLPLAFAAVLSLGHAAAASTNDASTILHGILAEEPLAVEIAPLPRLNPGGEAAETEVTVTVRCDAGTAATLRFEVEFAPDWTVVTLDDRDEAISPSACDEGLVTITRTLAVAAAEGAPARDAKPALVRATLEGGPRPESRAATVDVEAAFVGRLVAVAEPSSATAEPQETLQFPVRLQNLGNGPTTLHFALVTPPGWNAPTPPSLTLGTGSDSESIVTVAVMTPYRNGHVVEQATLHLRITSSHALHGDAGDVAEVYLLARVDGFFVPGPAPVAGIVVLLVAALLARGSRLAAGPRTDPP